MGVSHLGQQITDSMAQVQGVRGVAGYSDPPFFEPYASWNEVGVSVRGGQESVPAYVQKVSGSFVSAMEMELVAGRSARPHLPRPSPEYVINETAVPALGFDSNSEALGELVGGEWCPFGPIVGVVRDFHFQTLHEAVKPTLLRSPGYDDRNVRGELMEAYSNYLVRIDAAALPQVLDDLTTVWKSYAPEFPFFYQFIDEQFDRRHRAEQQLFSLVGGFAGIALLLVGLGVFGMAAFSAQERTKEIGVRKVLGASRGVILVTLGRGFGRMFAIAAVVAIPLGVLVTQRWLDGFPYHIDTSMTLVASSVLAVLVTAMLAMTQQIARASALDPVDALRYE